MPEISRFFGIVIAMYYDDHNPPHFHARYGEHKVSVTIKDFAILEGSLPPRTLGFVIEWASLHRDELMKDWEHAEKNQPLSPIKPLE